MRRSTVLVLFLALAAAGCGGKHQNPVGSDDELGTTHVVQDEKPATYVTKAGDTLSSIAARPEIYADSELWPLIADANEKNLSGVSARHALEGGMVLSIPRYQSADELDEARERARQAAAAIKARRHAPKRPQPEALPTKAPAPKDVAAAAPTPVPTPVPAKPVPPARSGGMMPILLLLLLVLAGLGAVLYVFSRKDKQDRA